MGIGSLGPLDHSPHPVGMALLIDPSVDQPAAGLAEAASQLRLVEQANDASAQIGDVPGRVQEAVLLVSEPMGTASVRGGNHGATGRQPFDDGVQARRVVDFVHGHDHDLARGIQVSQAGIAGPALLDVRRSLARSPSRTPG